RAAAEKGIQGTVVVQADVDAQGNITDARVLCGPPELRKAVLQPVLTWRFKGDGSAGTRQISVAFQVPPLEELDAQEKNFDRRRAEAREIEAKRLAALEREFGRRLDQDHARYNPDRFKQDELIRDREPIAGRILSRIDFDKLPTETRVRIAKE